MISSRALIVAGAVLSALLIVLATVPARFVNRLVDQDTVHLSGLSGSLWRGRAARAVLSTSRGPVHLGELRWRVSPLSLLTFAPRIALRTEWGMQRVRLVARPRSGQLLLRDVDASFNAALLQQLLPITVAGRLELQFEELRLAQNLLIEARGQLVWREAAWRSASGLNRLGSYALLVTTGAVSDSDDTQISAGIETLAGPVRAEGSAVLRGRRYFIDANIDAQGGLHPELERALALIASPAQSGYLLRLDGDLPDES
ncbi:MAG: hypothetical protein ACI87W_000176 [Halieaceae bacterium]